MKPTQIILTLLSLASAAVQAADSDKNKQGWSGKLSTLDGGLQGTVTVSAPDKLVITDYKLEDASAPALYWWGSATSSLSDGFRISNKHVTEAATSDTTEIMLDAGKSTADFMTVGLWCEKFSANFGQATLMEQTGGNGNGDMTTPTMTTGSGMPQTTGDKMNGSHGIVGAVEWVWVMAGLGIFTFLLM
ncbi:hypothetical protein V8F33_002622 [Rhypophila sp. PSN 637]